VWRSIVYNQRRSQSWTRSWYRTPLGEVYGTLMDYCMHEQAPVPLSIRCVCANLPSEPSWTWHDLSRIPQHARWLLRRFASNLLSRCPDICRLICCRNLLCHRKVNLGHTDFCVLVWKKPLMIAPHVLILGALGCTAARHFTDRWRSSATTSNACNITSCHTILLSHSRFDALS
jgi:hypothetical protein